MLTGILVHLLGFLPVLLFLTGLRYMDSYKLVRRGAVLGSLLAGGLAALACIPLDRLAMDLGPWSPIFAKRYVAPVIEECVKAIYLVYLVRAGRTGFLVDSAIHGFAIGTGFALIENAVYAFALRDPSIGLWLVRGLGTAVMHGSATAIVAIMAKEAFERRTSARLLGFASGLAVAIVVHSGFNHFIFPPIVNTAIVLLTMPLVLTAVFEVSERSTHAWLTSGFDSDYDFLESMGTDLGTSRIGSYLRSLRQWFPGEAVADMLCYLRLHFELSMRAKGMLMAREAGMEIPPDPQVPVKLEELRFLSATIGKTGHLAILPFIRRTTRDAWQLEMLRKGHDVVL